MPTIFSLHPVDKTRSRIQEILSPIPETTCVDFADEAEALTAIEKQAPDLIIAELTVAEQDNAAFIRKIQTIAPDSSVFLVGEEGSVEQVLFGLQVGAAGFVHEAKFDSELFEHIQRVLSAADRNKCQARLLDCMQTSCSTFEIENDPALLPTLLGRFQASVNMFGVCDEASRTRIGIALEEAMTNSLYHGNLEVSSDLREEGLNIYYAKATERRAMAPYKNRKLHITETITKTQASFTIRDEGPGFDTSKLGQSAPEDLEAVSGRGLMLMQAFMDEVHFSERGNEVTLVKYKDACPLALAA